MAFKIGTVNCQCRNVMGMPSDTGECTECPEKKTFNGEKSFSRLEEWAKEHNKIHNG